MDQCDDGQIVHMLFSVGVSLEAKAARACGDLSIASDDEVVHGVKAVHAMSIAAYLTFEATDCYGRHFDGFIVNIHSVKECARF